MRKTMFAIVILALTVVFVITLIVTTNKTKGKSEEKPGKQFFVAKDGNDMNDGSIDHPFATLEKARDAVRALKSTEGIPTGGVAVQIRTGEYRFTNTFQLEEKDSGGPNQPVVYKAYEGEKVSFVGGEQLDDSLFKPVTDSAVLGRIPNEAGKKVLQVDLKALGVKDYGVLGNNLDVAPELFLNGNAMTLARWPNNDFTTVSKVVKAPDSNASKGYTFTFKDDGLHPWKSIEHTWMLGYWGNDWATNDLQIKSIDLEKKTIETLKETSYAMKAGQRFYFYNILEELDAPGEWYLDRGTGILYFYPPSPLQDKTVQLSIFNKNLISMKNASNMVFSGIKMEVNRGNAVDILGGQNNQIKNCEISKMGGYAVKIDGGKNNGVIGCRIYSMGNGGILLNGGDSTNLIPAGNYAENNDISNFARIKLTYTSAVELNGVGNRASHNKMHDSPHLAIQFRGNDHIMEYNEIYNVVKETADASAIYSGRSFVWRGNIIRYNYFHDIAANDLRVSTAAIYLDDYMSGVEMRGNVFYNIGKQAFKLANGRENVVENNIILESGTSIAFLARGYKSGEKNYNSLMSKFDQVPYKSKIWSDRYPTLPNILKDDPLLPKKNVVRNNVIVKSGAISGDSKNMELGTFDHNITFTQKEDLGFVDAANGNFQLKDDSVIISKIPDFKKIPFGDIGIKGEGLPPAQSGINPTSVQYMPNAGDLTIHVDLNENKLVTIKDQIRGLTEGIDYVNKGSSVVLKKEFLSKMSPGQYALTFSFSAGNEAFLYMGVAASPGSAKNDSSVKEQPDPKNNNLAANKSYSTSSKWGDDFDAAKAFDGDSATRWAAEKGKIIDQYVTIDFGGESTYNQIILKETSYPRVNSYVLQYSEDGINYTDISGTAGTTIGASKTIRFAPVESQYLRLWIYSTAQESSGAKEPTLNEMEVYNAS